MKSFLLIPVILAPLFVAGQFPAPTNFEFSYTYFTIDGGGYCEGQYFSGPGYCSYFQWNAPDALPQNKQLLHYNLYFKGGPMWGDTSTVCFASTTETYYEIHQGFIGWMWVTAVYSDPAGESVASDTAFNADLPIGISQAAEKTPAKVWYDAGGQRIRFTNPAGTGTVYLYDCTGQMVRSVSAGNEMMTGDLPRGVYLVKTGNFVKKIALTE